tara:strand:- start:139273 stop:139530 length:258 start_codon:yes stop_codon:yes gene_type:complete
MINDDFSKDKVMNTKSKKVYTRVPLFGAIYIFSLLFLLGSCSSNTAVKNSVSKEQDISTHSHQQNPATKSTVSGTRVKFLKSQRI